MDMRIPLSLSVCMYLSIYLCIYMHIYIYIYTYIYCIRTLSRYWGSNMTKAVVPGNTAAPQYTYIYIYTIYLYIHIYIYICTLHAPSVGSEVQIWRNRPSFQGRLQRPERRVAASRAVRRRGRQRALRHNVVLARVAFPLHSARAPARYTPINRLESAASTPCASR